MTKKSRNPLLDTAASPEVLIPIFGGFTTLILNWAVTGSTLFTLFGLIGIVGGAGVAATKLIMNIEKITNDAYHLLQEEKYEQQQKELDELDAKLTKDRDYRTQTSLRELRNLYESFQSDVRKGKAKEYAKIVEQVEELFRTCVQQLEYSYELWEISRKLSKQKKESVLEKNSRKLSKQRKDGILEKRESVVREIVDSVNHLTSIIEQFHTLSAERLVVNNYNLRKELDRSITVAKNVQRQVSELDNLDKLET